MTAFRTILAELTDSFAESDSIRHAHNVYQLATLADCYSPDGDDSPGAKFLASVARDVAEHMATADGLVDADPRDYLTELTDGDAAHEIADGAVPIYTHDRWATFVDLGAYNEDATEFGDVDGSDLTGAAGVALYLIASRLVAALAEELREALDADDEDDDQAQIDQETDLRDSDAYNA